MPTSKQISSGIGLRAQHMRELISNKSNIGFLEAHTENYFGGGNTRKQINQIAEIYPVSLHGVGLSLGRADDIDLEHLQQTKSLVDEINPIFVSEHLSWSAYSHTHVPDLLPTPFINEAMDIFTKHINVFQDTIQRQILIENPSNYLAFADIDYTEPEFLNELSKRTGCGILLDINNIAVSAHNLGYSAKDYINAIDANGQVKQFHLAGYQANVLDNGEEIYIDTHGKIVSPDVWDLYSYALKRFGDVPTLIEWDTDIPTLETLIAEAHKADGIRKKLDKENNHDYAA